MNPICKSMSEKREFHFGTLRGEERTRKVEGTLLKTNRKPHTKRERLL